MFSMACWAHHGPWCVPGSEDHNTHLSQQVCFQLMQDSFSSSCKFRSWSAGGILGSLLGVALAVIAALLTLLLRQRQDRREPPGVSTIMKVSQAARLR